MSDQRNAARNHHGFPYLQEAAKRGETARTRVRHRSIVLCKKFSLANAKHKVLTVLLPIDMRCAQFDPP